MNKKFFIIFSLICLIAFFANILITYTFVKQLFYSLDDRRKELYRIYQYEIYLSFLKDAETSERGFVITGNPSYLEPYNNSILYFNSKSTQDFLEKELDLSDDNTDEKIKKIKNLKEEKFKELDQIIQERKKSGFEEARNLMENNTGKRIMDEVRQLINSIIKEKQERINLLDKNIQWSMDDAVKLLIISNSLAIILISLCLFSIYKSIMKIQNKDEQLSSALQKLNDSLAIREAILNSTHYAIISVDPKGIITSFNPAAEKMLEYRRDEVVGRHTPFIFHDPKEIEERALALSKQLKTKVLPGFDVFILFAKQGIADSNEWTYIRKDGSRIPVSLCVTAIKNINNQIIGYVGIADNITERKEINRMKNELIAITSHELRSPVVAIKGTLDLLSQEEFALNDQAKKILALGQKNCNRLIRLTDDILDIQKIEIGKIEFNFKKLNVATFLSQAFLSNAFAAQQSHVSLVCETVPPQWNIEADEDRLMQVLNNLISNAITYSPKGSTIKISAQKIDSTIRFEVKDQGPGIAKELQDKIFQTFTRDTSSMNGEKRGIGLGLSIVKSIIEKHQGLINFQTSSQGTTFWFELPLLES